MKVWVALIHTSSLGTSTGKKIVAVGTNKRKVQKAGIINANTGDGRRIGVVDKEMVYVDYEPHEILLEQHELIK